nr:hypothetical protein [Shewanella maritima]
MDGALLLFGSGESFADSAAAFAGQLVGLYSQALGQWSWLLMAIVTFVALFSTTFAVADGFSQVWQRAVSVLAVKRSVTTTAGNIQSKAKYAYPVTLLVLSLGSWWIISAHTANIKGLLDFVTTVSFVSAPLYAWLNYKVMLSDEVQDKYRPQGAFKVYTLGCLLILTLFSLFYLYWKFGF